MSPPRPAPSPYTQAAAAVAARAALPAAAAFVLITVMAGPALPRTAGAVLAAALLFWYSILGERLPRLRSRPRRVLRWSARAVAAAVVATAILPETPRLMLLGAALAAALAITVVQAAMRPLEPQFPDRRLWELPLDEVLRARETTRGASERWVEVPWVLEQVPPGACVLDLGHAHADPAYRALLSARAGRVVGLDLVAGPGVAVRGDARRLPFADRSFDAVASISTIEHVGCDNARYGGAAEAEPGADLRAVAELLRVLRPGGAAWITVPYGRGEDRGWFRQYDAAALARLLAPAGGARIEYFGYRRGWRRVSAEDLAAARYGAGEAPAATGVACLELRR